MKTLINGLIAIFLVTGIYYFSSKTIVEAEETLPEKIVVVERVVYKEPSTPKEYIEYKFGEYADNAFKVLQGEGCAENRTLNPYAVNDNTTWGGVGRDRGIFQINSIFHPLTDAEAFDWRINIDYAYRMFVNDNHTFRRWTCGRYFNL